MHYRLFITLDAEPGATSDDVRREAHERLSADDTFCGDGGRFGYPLCDWFVIGGRWSGCLAESLLREGYREALVASLPQLAEPFYSDDYVREHAETLRRIWAEHGGTGQPRQLRDAYAFFGAEDDAMPLTRELYEGILRDYHGQTEHYSDGCEYADLEHEALTEEGIGRKWVVVVDYHN